MTIWLRKRLTVCISASLLLGALMGNGRALQAQNQNSSPAKVAKDFFSLNFVAEPVVYDHSWGKPTTGIVFLILQHVSTRSQQQLGPENTRKLLGAIKDLLAKGDTDFVTKEQKQGASQTQVQVQVCIQSPPLKIALIQEKGLWKVDLIDTYSQSTQLKGAALAAAIYKITGVRPTFLEKPPVKQNTTKTP